MHIIQLLEFPLTFTYQTSWENNNIYKLYILPYHKCQLVLKSLHKLLTYTSQYSFTRHSNRMTYSMFDILLYNTSLNQTRTEISTFLMSLHQALLLSPPQRVHQALSLTKWPGTLPHLLCGLLTPMCWRPSGLMIHFLHLRQPSLTTCCLCHPESWQKEHYYILYLKSPSYTVKLH